MKNKICKWMLATLVAGVMLTGCGASDSKEPVSEPQASANAATNAASANAVASDASANAATNASSGDKDEAPAASADAKAAVADGVYVATFDTDGSMFHVNETCDGKGVLTVKDGQMTIHLIMPSQNTVNLFVGMAEDAQAEGSELLEASIEEVTYEDGTTEEVNAFDLPVPVLDEEFDVALVGKKGKWYDHKVSVTIVGPYAAEAPADGTYAIEATLAGGSGKASIESPLALTVADGAMTATITWSSPYYDYMLVDGERYEPVNTEGNSVFEIPVAALDTELEVIADTTAMSKPHEVSYTLYFDSATLDASQR